MREEGRKEERKGKADGFRRTENHTLAAKDMK
jgi:hypothetical protein